MSPRSRAASAAAARAVRPAASGAVLAVVLGLTGCAGSGSVSGERTSAASPAGSPTPSASATPAPTPSATGTRTPITVPELKVPPSFSGAVLGGDVSWPQCPEGMGIPEKRSLGLPMPLPSAKFVILGLTNGPGFTPNPCLADQVRWVAERGLMAAAYAVTSYPDDATLEKYRDQGPYDGSSELGALRNVGYQQALFNLATMEAAGLRSPVVWIDVEPVPVFEWSDDLEANAAVVEGAARGYTDRGHQIGAYSTQALWRAVVGDLALGIPEWRAAGQTSRQEALRRCGEEAMFQGGQGVIAQWVQDQRDLNVTCPGTEGQMFRWFHQY
ncbi:hypothetical protein [Nocardioides caldifontis]|uniref:hypothetical protein n=1 Tax=Nocardioides caldifontis TaxID=2588938 RepID=UPI001EEFD37C|nr:hypothetical protein [Nocardioides caldifontis]